MARNVPIRLVVAVTDGDWFAYLRQRPDLTEVNFWSPSPKQFRALKEGELFLFKLHSPKNFIVGGGVFAHATVMPCALAWEAFGTSNGAASLDEMRTRIARYRRADTTEKADFQIGCRVLTQPCFLPESAWLPVPSTWAPNIVSFKTFSTEDSEGLALWEAVEERFRVPSGISGLQEFGPRFGEPTVIRPRLGQGAFRLLVTDSYDRRCAVTRERTLPALEAAHIRPYSSGGEHDARNGLLLRRDLHSLFDNGYVTVTPKLHLEVSRKIKEEFSNGREYYKLHGVNVHVPERLDRKPDPTLLTWHNDNRYLG